MQWLSLSIWLPVASGVLLLDRYVAEKHYLKGGDFSAFKRAQKG